MEGGKMKYMGTYEELQHSDEIQHIMESISKTAIEEDKEENNLDDIIDEDGEGSERKSFFSEVGSEITEDENKEITNVPWRLYIEYFIKDKAWIVYSILIPLFIGYAYFAVYTTYYYGQWIREAGDKESYWSNFVLAILHPLGFSVLIFIIIIMIIFASISKSRKIHEKMLVNSMNAPINLYFDKTPSGIILNRYSNDIDKLDSVLPRRIIWAIE